MKIFINKLIFNTKQKKQLIFPAFHTFIQKRFNFETFDSMPDMKTILMKSLHFLFYSLLTFLASAQISWKNVDSEYTPLPHSMHIYFSNDSIGGRPGRMFYCIMDLKDKSLDFAVDTAKNRGITPERFYAKNKNPLLVVNCTFFSPKHANLNIVIEKGKLLAYNVPAVYDKNSNLWNTITRSAIGINKHRKADVAWIFTDSTKTKAWELPYGPVTNKSREPITHIKEFRKSKLNDKNPRLKRWRMETAVGGGPNLISDGKINITNNEEGLFSGDRIKEKHPRTAMGYTKDGKLIVLAIEGRFQGVAEGATLYQEAEILQQLGCIEALNLDGGGSSCLLINGKQTITPSDKTGQRAVPAVFMVK